MTGFITLGLVTVVQAALESKYIYIIGVWQSLIPITFFFSLIQFLLVPYSFFVSFGLIIANGPQIYFSHYLTFISIQMISNLLQYFCLPTSITPILAQISSYFELPIGFNHLLMQVANELYFYLVK